MQLLRDNLTLWTSSDGAEPEAGAQGDSKTEEKAEEAKKEAPAATEGETAPAS